MTGIILRASFFIDNLSPMKQFTLNVLSIVGFIFFLSYFPVQVLAQEWTTEDKEIWKKAVKRVVTTPPCCGACSVLSMNEGRKAYRYVTGEEKSAEGGKIYSEHKNRILEAFHYFNPERFEHWFGKELKQSRGGK